MHMQILAHASPSSFLKIHERVFIFVYKGIAPHKMLYSTEDDK